MPKATVRANARILPDATDPSTVVDDNLFIALRAEIEDLKVKRRPLEDTADALYQSFEHTIREDGFEAARAWGNSVASIINLKRWANRPSRREVSRADARARPRTPASIAAVAAVLRDEAFAHYWKETEDDRDWDVALLTRFLDGLIALRP